SRSLLRPMPLLSLPPLSSSPLLFYSFFFNNPPPTKLYPLSLHDALPILILPARRAKASSSTGAGCGIWRAPRETGGSSWFCCLSWRFFGIRASGRAGVTLCAACWLRNTKTSTPFPAKCRFNSLFGFTALKVKLAAMVQLALSRTPLWPLDLILSGQTFAPETTRLMGVAFETARAAVNRRADLTDEMIAKKIIELAKAGERNV